MRTMPKSKFEIDEIIAIAEFTDSDGKHHARIELARVIALRPIDNEIMESMNMAPYWRVKVHSPEFGPLGYFEASERFFEKLGECDREEE